MADLERIGACETAQDQFGDIFGRGDVAWNRRNYNKAMASFVKDGYYPDDSLVPEFNYMNPEQLYFQMRRQHGYPIALADEIDDRNSGTRKGRQEMVEFVWERLEYFRLHGGGGETEAQL